MSRWGRAAAAGLILMVLASLVPLLASARHVTVRDRNDTKGILDIRRVETKSASRWKVVSWRGWKAGRIWDRGYTLVFVDSFGSDRADYYVLVKSDGRKLSASLYRDRQNRKDRRIRAVRVRHPRRKVVTVKVPVGRLRRRDSGVYSWYVLTMFNGNKCRRVCFDRAPDNGAIKEPGPQPTPTVPTPTPTVPTPTPTPTPTGTPAPTPTGTPTP